ncbi:glycosyltransferase family 4 protein [Thioclava sp. FR2]|uniref:glycosyltransferase family 4 protein n=1 Tax=Thioclava sp. FR2 TaxID=3445780 RepID=UPI003EB804C8
MSDVNSGGYEFVSTHGGKHITQPGLRTSLSISRAAKALRGISTQIDIDQPNLVWAHARMAVLLLRLIAVWRHIRKKPLPELAITLHGLPFGPGHRPFTGWISRATELGLLRMMPPHHLLFLSQAALDTYARSPGMAGALNRHSTHVLENCANLEPIPREKRDGIPIIVMTGRVGYQKNHRLAAQIFGKVRADFQFLLCGEGTNSSDFREHFIQNSGLKPDDVDRRVTFLGPVADVRPILHRADIFLSTSRYEGMPIAALEAFQAGLPIATTNILGMAEIVAAHPMSVSFSDQDPEMAAKEIERLVAEMRKDEMSHTSQIQAAFSKRFSFSKWSENLIPLIRKMSSSTDIHDANRP